MSTDYTHFSNLAFTNLFARGPDGNEVLIINSSGLIITAVSFSKLTVGAGSTASASLTVASAGLGLYRAGSKQLGITVNSANVATFSTAGLSVTGNITASNFSGTNTGDVTLGTANGLSLVGQALSMAAASTSTAGVVSTGTQSFAGTKTFVTALAGTNVASASTSASGVLTTGTQSLAGAKTFVGNFRCNALSSFGGGLAPNAAIVLAVYNSTGKALTGTTQYGIYSAPEFSSVATSVGHGFYSVPQTKASSFTCPFIGNYSAHPIVKGSGSSITRIAAFYSNIGTGTATNSAMFADNQSFTGDWVINSTSTSPSLLTGYLQLSSQADPGAVTDGIRLGSIDLSAGNATLSLRTETAVVSETVVSDRTLSVQINGTTYKICLKA